MELLQQPEIKSTYDKCKLKVKYWEHNFKKKHGRLPSKLDIREADRETRLAYKTYFNLKSAALEQSFQDIDGFNSDEETPDCSFNTPNSSSVTSSEDVSTPNTSDVQIESTELDRQNDAVENSSVSEGILNVEKVWGAHLNNSAIYEKKEEVKKGMTVNTNFAKKLFKNSNFSKKNPRKSLSFHHRKSETSLNISKSLSQPTNDVTLERSLSQPEGQQFSNSQTSTEMNFSQFSESDLLSEKENDNFFNNIKISSLVQPIETKSVNVVQSVLDENFKSSRNLDAGWVQRIAATSGTKMVNKSINANNFSLSQKLTAAHDSDSDDIIGDSDEEDSVMHPAKRARISLSQNSRPVLDYQNAYNESRKISEKQISSLSFTGAFNSSSQSTANIATAAQNGLYNINQNVSSSLNSNSTQSNTDSNSISQNDNKTNSVSEVINDEQMEVDEDVEDPIVLEKSSVKNKKNQKKPVRKASVNKTKTAKQVKSESNEPPTPIRRTTRQRKNLVDLELYSDADEDPFNDPESADPEFDPNPTPGKATTFNFNSDDENPVEKPKKITEKSPKTKKPSKKSSDKGKKNIEEEDEDENATYELEFSVKPRIKTVPRDPDLKNVVRKALNRKARNEDADAKPEVNNGGIKSKEEMNLEKLKQKAESGNLNENFVRIDIKKKVYARGKKGMNFSKYKKKMWKQNKKNSALAGPDMDMGGCDGGMLTCFKCGKTGHFARNCQADKCEGLLPLSAADQEYCPFPTLEEASQMAKESHLAVRAPARNKNEEGEEGVIPGSSSDSEDSDCGNADGSEVATVEGEEEDNSDDELLAEALKLEEYVKKIDMQEYVDSTRSIKPYYNLNENGKIIDTPAEVFEALRMFGHSSFRPGQEAAIMRILSGQSTLVTLSTGSGKSLCYQLPAYLYAKREPCIALIISPLVSLMEDQVTGIPAFLKAACLHTNKTKTQREKILEEIGSGSLDVLLVSPEAVVAGEKSSGFGSLLRKLPPVAFACIDEAHCVSQWSHNFRPSYLMICRILKERLGIHTILGLTATATRATSDSIISHLSIPDGRSGIISDTPLPDNLRLTVSKDVNRDHALLGLLLSERFENLKSIIIYCTRRQECERIASFLRTSLKSEKPTEVNSKKRKKCNVQAEPYHAGLPASRRRTIQKNFMSGELRIVVATVAFGMGINKSDIRAVVHYNLPKNFESYVQEVGRAGRDGLPAHCHLFLDPRGGDENELQRHIYSDSIDRHVIRKLLQKIFIPCSCKKICPKHEVAFSIEETVSMLDIPEENISTLLCYLELKDERYIEVLSPSYVTCKVIAYGGANIIRKAAKECPPLAMALVMFGNENSTESCFEFPVVEVAAAMGWDSGICKHKLKNLEWTKENNQSKRSLLTVQFVNLGFRVLAPGNLTGEQLDDTLDILYNRVVDQEKTALLQLHSLHETVTSVANQTYRTCISDESDEKELKLKTKIREYFDSPNPLSLVEVKEKKVDEGLIANDVRAMVSLYRDNNFTGRAIARIFYGIPSPNYPAVIWGRCKYWRAHINEEFNAICRIATREILRMR